MNTKNFFVFGIIILVAVYLYSINRRSRNSVEHFRPKMSLLEAESLDEWNKNAAAYLCELPTDNTAESDKGFLITFCNRMIQEKDYKRFSFLAVDKAVDGRRKRIFSSGVHYGKTKSDKFIEYPNKYIASKTIEYVNTDKGNCEKMAAINDKAIGFNVRANGNSGCWIKSSMGPAGKPLRSTTFNSFLRGSGFQFSYSMWLKIEVLAPHWRCIAIRSESNGGKPSWKDRRPGMWIHPNQTAFHFRISTTDYWNDGLDIESGKIPFNKYVHICYTVNGRHVKAYVNGKLEKEKILSGNPNPIRDDLPLFVRPSNHRNFEIAKFRVFPLAVPQKLIESVLMMEIPDSNTKFNTCMKNYIGNNVPGVQLMRIAAQKCNNDNNTSEFKFNPRENNYRYIQLADNSYKPEDSSGVRPPSYKISNGMVFLSGSVNNMNTTGAIGWLPLEARPKLRHIFSGINTGDDNNIKGRIDITKEGIILVVEPNKVGTYSLDNIYFPLSPGTEFKFEIPSMCYYVKIIRPGRGILSVAEVQVFDNSNTNVALNKDTDQSTTQNSGNSSRAVDGNTNTNWNRSSITHTRNTNDNYLEINLGGGYRVKRVVVFNRKDCCSERIAGAKIILLDRNKKEIIYKIWDPKDYKTTDKLTRTLSGRNCQNWQKQRPHRNKYSTPHWLGGGGTTPVNRWATYSKYWHKTAGSGTVGGGQSFWWYCRSGIKSYKYNPWGLWGAFSNYAGIGKVKCEDNSRPRRWYINKDYAATYPYRTKNISKASYNRSQIGDHNYGRDPDGSGKLWCYTTDPRVRRENVGVDGRTVKSTKEKIYPAQKTFVFNMGGSVPSGFANYDTKGTYAKATYKKIGDYVYLNGIVKHLKSPLTKDKVIDILPVGFRPRFRKMFNVTCGKDVIRMDVLTDGKIIFLDAKDDSTVFKYMWIPFDGIRFKISDNFQLNLSPAYISYSGVESLNNGIVFRLNNFTKLVHTHSFTTHGNSTMSMWLKPNKNGRQNPYFAGYAGEGAITLESNGSLSFYYGNGYANSGKYQGFNSVSRIKYGKWSHIVIVKDLSNRKLKWYINGVKVKETRAKFDRAGNSSSWGQAFGYGYANRYSGKMKSIRVYNRALSSGEIRSLKDFSGSIPPNYGPPMVSEKNGLVSLSGVASIRKVNEFVANLPEKFRPNADLFFHTNQNSNSTKVHITQTGNVNISNVQADEGLITLDGIMYMKNK